MSNTNKHIVGASDKVCGLLSLMKITRLSVISLLFAIAVSTSAQNDFSSLPDSIQNAIRTTSYLLIDADQVENIPSDVPFAIDARKIHTKLLNKLSQKLGDLQNRQPLFLLLTDKRLTCRLPRNIVCIDSTFYSIFQLQEPIDYQNISLKKDLLWIEVPKDFSMNLKNIDALWISSGKMPNFFHFNVKTNLNYQLINQLNEREKISGVIKSSQGVLNDVIIPDTVYKCVNGYFCFPSIAARVLKPHKPGYHFSPNIIVNTDENLHQLKIFEGTKYDLYFGLTDKFIFDKKVTNSCRKHNNGIILKDVKFVTDNEQGASGLFHNSFVDAGTESEDILKSDFTITLWIKPTVFNSNNGIISKGADFAIKLCEGYLTYTLPDVKDFVMKKQKMPLNKWTHLAVVHSEIENNVKFFVDGKLFHQINLPSEYVPTNNSMLIGNSIWQEPFNGYINVVKIWNRELNIDEIKADYAISGKKNQLPNYSIILLLLGMIATGLILFFIIKKKKISILSPSDSSQKDAVLVNENVRLNPTGIFVFGDLSIINNKGEELAHKLPPKLKQIFILILMSSLDGKKGITSQQMSDLLWPGIGNSNAKNIRSTNIQHLRHVLSLFPELSLSFDDKMWKITSTGSVFCDYAQARRLQEQMNTAEKPSENLLAQWISIMSRGRLLKGIETTWTDIYKERFSNQAIEFCIKTFEKLTPSNRCSSMVLNLTSIISMYDELNEDALRIKINILTAQGKHSLAKSTFEMYQKLYAELYQSNYEKKFQELLK